MKKILTLISVFFLLGLTTNSAHASLLVIGKEGNIVWKVLSKDTSNLDIPKHSSIEVKEIADSSAVDVSMVSLEKQDSGKISLVVSSGKEKRELDVTGIKEGLVEIEERPSIRKLTIGVKDNSFILYQNSIRALTEFPISVDPKTAEIIVKTPSGNKYVSVFPTEAAATVLRTKIITNITDNQIKIVEEGQELQYEVKGDKVINFFDIYQYMIPVGLRVSASNGEILSIEAPVWYKVIGFFLT